MPHSGPEPVLEVAREIDNSACYRAISREYDSAVMAYMTLNENYYQQ